MIKTLYVEEACSHMRIDRWLRHKIGKIPQSLIQKTLRNGKIKVNKKKGSKRLYFRVLKAKKKGHPCLRLFLRARQLFARVLHYVSLS